MWLSILRDALRAPQDEDVKFRSRDAICIRVIFKRHESFASNGREAVLQAPLVRREAERREAHPYNGRTSGRGRGLSGDRSPFGAPPRLSPEARRPTGSTPGHASWDVDPAGATRLHLSQSRDSTSRTGRSTGMTDARSRPGAGRNPARRRRPRSAFRSTLAKASFVERGIVYVIAMGTVVTSRLRYRD